MERGEHNVTIVIPLVESAGFASIRGLEIQDKVPVNQVAALAKPDNSTFFSTFNENVVGWALDASVLKKSGDVHAKVIAVMLFQVVFRHLVGLNFRA